VRALLAEAQELTEGWPFLEQVAEDARYLWRTGNYSAAHEVATSIMVINDPAARRICLYDDHPAGSRLGMIPGIYDAVIDAIDGALRLGKQGGDLDPWIVAEAAARFRKLQSATIPTADAPAAPPSSATR
jgi:hypothetical protein